MKKSPLIAVLTDFGTIDPFVGIMKGVIARIAPEIPVVDLTNNIPRGDVKRAAVNLWQSCSYFPRGTVFLCVVDPGVGTSRNAILVQSGDYSFIGPDNGLFTFMMTEDAKAWELNNPQYGLSKIGSTFHGRDVFAPAAAYAALGIPGAKFGPIIRKPVNLVWPRLKQVQPGVLRGEILFADRFGNLLTSLGCFEREGDLGFGFIPWLPVPGMHHFDEQWMLKDAVIELEDGTGLSWAKTFEDIPAGKCAFIIGSSGLIEIASNRQDAKQRLDLGGGDPVILRLKGEPHG
ncbi:MAG TPA: SAM-dependent chlorinase/fluorinase [Anaerolineales bacterium]